MFKVGEALMGEGEELAHIDLVIGSKSGPVGTAFTNGMTQLSAGHTPLFAVIRPNLPVKPSTLIVPKVTVKNLDQASKIFGPAQTGVAKAIADAMDEGIIQKEEAEDQVIIASVFIHPEAKDYNKIYRYNYGATKLALKRALSGFPDADKVLYEKDRSTHPVMGFRVTKLWDPPYLQIALDVPDWNLTSRVLAQVPKNDHLIIEAGTPLIKRYGLDIVARIREIKPDAFIVADLKTLDTGNLEARMASDVTADAVVISGLAPIETIDKAIEEAKKTGIYAAIDMLNVEKPLDVLKRLKTLPEVVELHRAIDVELYGEGSTEAWGNIKAIKELGKILVGVAGGITEDTVEFALENGADILIVGRAITKSKDVEAACRRFLKALNKEEIDQRRVMTDF
ncbi:MAG: formaldehyde-activating enzyme [Candidatus Omnitrophota bacterium]|nr:MAG: formaldehyde-activating enzyme [Candidatus Omnitrophota bacterium]